MLQPRYSFAIIDEAGVSKQLGIARLKDMDITRKIGGRRMSWLILDKMAGSRIIGEELSMLLI